MPEVDEVAVQEQPEVVETPAAETGPIEDRAKLEESVSKSLEAVFGDKPDDTKTLSEQVEDDAAAGEQEPEDTTATADEPVLTPTPTPTLPAAYVRSLKAMEWTDEEIAEAAKNPSFVTTAAKIHATRNKEIQSWAELGRKTREVPATKQDAPVQKADDGLLKPVDIADLKKKYGEDDLIDHIAGPVNRAIEQINKILPVVQQSQKTSQQAELETLGRQIEGFFGNKEMETYKDVYGSLKTGLQEKQIESRNKVLEMADALMAGARQQGRALSLDDALTLAHDSVSSSFKEQAARTTIKKQLKTRERGITLKPGGGKAPTGDKVTSRRELERKVGAGLAATFNR